MQYKYVLMFVLVFVGALNIFVFDQVFFGLIFVILGLLAPVIYPRIEAAADKKKGNNEAPRR